MIIAIDGPAGSGKSTVARLVARKLNFKYIETGSMYRAVAWVAQQAGVELEDQEGVAEIARLTKIEFEPGNDRQKVLIDGEDVTLILKTETVGRQAAIVAANPAVREILVEQQRKMGSNGNVVMDGRDIGTVVFPHANKKFFMVADRKERARRRYEEIREKNPEVEFESILDQVEKRDYEDENRKVSPLIPAQDSIRMDTTHMNIEDVVAQMIEAIGPVDPS